MAGNVDTSAVTVSNTTTIIIPAKVGYQVEVVGFFGRSLGTGAITLQDDTGGTVRSHLGGAATQLNYGGNRNSPIIRTAISKGLEAVVGASTTLMGSISWQYVR